MSKHKIPKSVTSAGTIETAINRAKDVLIKRANKYGLYENFGQAEADVIQEKFIPLCDYSNPMLKRRSLISQFRDWAANLSLEEAH